MSDMTARLSPERYCRGNDLERGIYKRGEYRRHYPQRYRIPVERHIEPRDRDAQQQHAGEHLAERVHAEVLGYHMEQSVYGSGQIFIKIALADYPVANHPQIIREQMVEGL